MIKTIIKNTNLDTSVFDWRNDADAPASAPVVVFVTTPGVVPDFNFENALIDDCFNELNGALKYFSVNEGCDVLIIIT